MKTLILTATAVLISMSFSTLGDFRLVKNENNIALYERWYTQSPGVQARELKAVFQVRTGMETLIAMLHNESKGKMWNSQASEFAIRNLKSSGWVNYIRYDLPWPMDDQDCVLQYSRTAAGGKTILQFSSTTHASFPVKKDVGRIPSVRGKWLLSPGPNLVKVEYYITTTPNAGMPRSITDPIIRNNLIAGMAGLKKLLE